jgi:hypothetical protein
MQRATSQFPDLASGCKEGEGLRFIGLFHQKIGLTLQSLQVGWVLTSWRFLNPPPQEPACTPQLDNARVSSVCRRGGGGGRGVSRVARIKSKFTQPPPTTSTAVIMDDDYNNSLLVCLREGLSVRCFS